MSSPGSGGALVLASASPRRRELLAQVGVVADVMPADIDETMQVDEAPSAYVSRLALEKARAVSVRPATGRRVVLGADTVVVLDDDVMGKPTSIDDARRMLTTLAGRQHHVLTGLALVEGDDHAVSVTRTDVTFRDLEPADVEAYLATGEQNGKAGSYAIQGHGALLVTSIVGSHANVVGLPLVAVDEALMTLGYRLRDFG